MRQGEGIINTLKATKCVQPFTTGHRSGRKSIGIALDRLGLGIDKVRPVILRKPVDPPSNATTLGLDIARGLAKADKAGRIERP